MVLVEEPIVPDSYVKPVVNEDVNQRLASMQGQILSRTRLQHLVEQFNLYKKDVGRVPREVLIEWLNKSIKVAPLNPMPGTLSRGLPGFTVDATLSEARLAQQVCTEITSMFMEQNLHLRQQQAEDTTQFLAKQLEEAKAKLDEQDAKLAAFQSRNMGALPEDEKTNLTLLTGMTPQLEAVTQGLNQARQEKGAPRQKKTKASIVEPPQNQQLRAQLQQVEMSISQKTQEQEQLERQIRVFQSRMQLSPVIQQEFKALTRDYQTALGFYNDLLKKRNESQMATELESRQQAEKFRVLDPPSLPEQPSFPNRHLFRFAWLCARLASGEGMAHLAESRPKPTPTRHDVEVHRGVPTLAIISQTGNGKRDHSWTNGRIPAGRAGHSSPAASWK